MATHDLLAGANVERADPAYTESEMMVIAASRELRNRETVLVGLGIPQLASDLAKLHHAPELMCLSEIGVFDPQPGGEPGVGNADPRLWRGAACFGSFLDVMGMVLHRGRVDVGFLGALEVDLRGNVNSTEVPTEHGIRRFGGSGGGNDIASHARRVLIVCRHGARKITEAVAHVTSPGYPEGPRVLPGGGPSRVITDRAVLGFNERGAMSILSIHPGFDIEDVVVPGLGVDRNGKYPSTAPPDEAELRLIREWLDPTELYTVRPSSARGDL